MAAYGLYTHIQSNKRRSIALLIGLFVLIEARSRSPLAPLAFFKQRTPASMLLDRIDVPASALGRGEQYALEVEGDAMVDAGIRSGDTVIIHRCDTAENGNIVVALVDSEEVTLKRLRRKGASIALEPANKTYETRIFGPDRVKVQGKLVGLLRRY